MIDILKFIFYFFQKFLYYQGYESRMRIFFLNIILLRDYYFLIIFIKFIYINVSFIT